MENLDLQTGDIILSQTNTLLSKIIRLFTRSISSHSEILVKVWDYKQVNGATGFGIRGSDLLHEIKKRKIIILRHKNYTNGISKESEKQLATRICSKLGTKYDFASLLYYQIIYQLFNKWIGKTEEKALNRLYCFEYVAWCYNLPNWWKYTANSFLENKDFIIIYNNITTNN